MSYLKSVEFFDGSWESDKSDLIVVGIYRDKSFTEMATKISNSHENVFKDAVSNGDITGKVGDEIFSMLAAREYYWLVLAKRKSLIQKRCVLSQVRFQN